jgi:hypothetical protein
LKEDEVGRTFSTHGGNVKCIQKRYLKNLEGRKRQLGRSRHKWDDNIKWVLKGVGWIQMVLDKDQWWAVVNMVLNIRDA